MNPIPTRYREIDVSGDPREMGRQIGEAAGEQVRGFCQQALEHVNRTVAVSPQLAEAVVRDSLTAAEQYSPDMVEELRGVAEASGVTLQEVMLLQVRNQFMEGMDHACTALSLDPRATLSGRALVAQNWDNDPALDAFTIVLTRRPTGKPALMNVTQAGLISYLGFNSAGIGVCVNTLPAPSRPVGVPHYFTLRGVYEATCLEDAVAAVRRAGTLTHGAVIGTMLRDESFHFARAGTFIERSDSIARILDMKYYLLLPSLSYVGSSLDTGQWDTVLRAVSGDRSYRWLNAGQIDARGIVEFLVLDERFPRSLSYCQTALRENLAALARMRGSEGQSNMLMRSADISLSERTIDSIFDQGLHEFLRQFMASNAAIGAAISEDYRFLS